LLVILITRVFRLVQFAGLWVGYVEVASFILLVAPCVVTFRKSTSLLHYAFVLKPLLAIELYLESHVRAPGVRALWDYTSGTFIGQIHPVPLRFLVILSVAALLVGPVCLWLSRLLARRLRGQVAGMEADAVVDELPFPASWQEGKVDCPRRDEEEFLGTDKIRGLLDFAFESMVKDQGPDREMRWNVGNTYPRITFLRLTTLD
jgi:hypothetical protein